MRVVIASDAIGEQSSLASGTIMGRAWAERGAQVAVVSMAVGGAALRESLDALGADLDVVDLTEGEPRDIPPGTVAVVAEDQLNLPLLGLQGSATARGRAEGLDLADVLALDADAAAWASRIWPDNPDGGLLPGSGAHGGAGLRVLAAGGTLTTGPLLCSELAHLTETARRADLVVTGCDTLDFGTFGGPVVAEVSRVANAALRPLVVLAGRNHISGRELRNAGIEAAHETGGDLAAVARRVSASWSW